MTAAPASAPELDGTIREALAELEHAITEAKLHDDPLRLPLTALASFLRAQQQLYADAALTVAQQIAAAKRPIADEDIRRVTQAASNGALQQAMRLARAANWRTLVLGIAVSVAVLVGSNLGSYWYGRAQRVAEVQHAVDGLAAAAVAHGGPAAAEQWLALMRDNDITTVHRTGCQNYGGHEGCEFGLWVTAPPPAPVHSGLN